MTTAEQTLQDTGERYRCTAASLADAEPMAGTAPTDTSYLFVEHGGPWGRKAVEESRLPEEVRSHLTGLAGVRVQLIRRYGGQRSHGVRVFAAELADEVRVSTALLDEPHQLLDLRSGRSAEQSPVLAAEL